MDLLAKVLVLLTAIVHARWSHYAEPFPEMGKEGVSWNDDDNLPTEVVEQIEPSNFKIQSEGISSDLHLFDDLGCEKSCESPCTSAPSLPLTWTEPPERATSLVLLMDRLTSTPKHFIHWLVVDIPPDGELVRGASASDTTLLGAQEQRNTYREEAYAAPCGEDGEYRLVMFALAGNHTDFSDFFEENPTALGNEIQHHLVNDKRLLAVDYIRFRYPFADV